MLSRSIPANAFNAEPVAARQREQWQFAAHRNSSATLYCTERREQAVGSGR
jgi:hypothetical protein